MKTGINARMQELAEKVRGHQAADPTHSYYAQGLGWWLWFPENNWHLVDLAVGEPEGDEYRTFCGKYLDGLFQTEVQEDRPLLYCKDCSNVKLIRELAE